MVSSLIHFVIYHKAEFILMMVLLGALFLGLLLILLLMLILVLLLLLTLSLRLVRLLTQLHSSVN